MNTLIEMSKAMTVFLIIQALSTSFVAVFIAYIVICLLAISSFNRSAGNEETNVRN